MALDEASRQRLYRSLERAIGAQEATTMMALLPASGWSEVATRKDLQVLEARLEAKLESKLNEQTKTLFRTFIVSNATLVLSVTILAFGAGRFG